MKVVIANSLATDIVDPVFASPGQYASLDVLVGVYGYSVQIFADFLGYTNIAIGIALLLGFQFPTNFDAPYTALSVRDFWRRWHMTLSRWLRDPIRRTRSAGASCCGSRPSTSSASRGSSSGPTRSARPET